MESFCVLVLGTFLLAFSLVTATPCKDTNEQACAGLIAVNPNLCQDQSVSENVCPKTCNKCHLTCYDCDEVDRPDHCLELVNCSNGEVCISHEFFPTGFQSRKFRLGCINKQICNELDSGWDARPIVGKRDAEDQEDIARRSIDIHCCDKDKCNGQHKADVPHYNLTFCTFETPCKIFPPNSQWTNQSANAIRVPDIDFNVIHEGHVMQIKGDVPVVSAAFKPSNAYCVRFWYRARSNGYTHNLLVYVAPVNDARFGNPIHTITNVDSSWRLATIDVSGEALSGLVKFQLMKRDTAAYLTYIDDFMVYNVNCSVLGIQTPRCGNESFKRDIVQEHSCYTFIPNPMTWKDAMLHCKTLWPGTFLVAIETQDEQNYLTDIIKHNTDIALWGKSGFWTSGNDIVTEGTFVWSFGGSAVSYTNWHYDQPNNLHGDQDCILMDYPTDNYQWADNNCTELHPFICESKY